MITKIYSKLPTEAKQIREEVFIKEQGFSEEYDEIDNIATHIVAFDGDTALATCRIFKGEEVGVFLLGRLAVKKEFRKKGIGSKLIGAAEEYAMKNGGKSIILHSQLHATQFYARLGFIEYGDIEYEENCPHIWMKKILD